MNRQTIVPALFVIAVILFTGCSSGNGDPLMPVTSPVLSEKTISTIPQTQTHLWGYWDIYIDLQNQTVNAVPNHQAEFSANVVSFLNKQGGLGFKIYDTIMGPGNAYVDVDIDVSLTHPLAGLPQYDGYDVRGIFIGDGSQVLSYGSNLYTTNRSDEQFLLDDPTNGDGGGPDGYTRWFNPDEFFAPGLLGYTPGAAASPGYNGTATLNGYKYFADGLAAADNLWDFLNSTADHGVFSSGSTNTRNYYIRFPMPPDGLGVKYGYAVCASWKGEAETDHPANTTEAVGVDVSIQDDIYYVSGTENGGDFIADISVFDWGSHLTAGVMEYYTLFIETEVANNVYMADTTDMTPVSGTDTYSTYHVEFAADNLTYNSIGAGHDAEYWVIVEYAGQDYKYPDNPDVPAPDATLAAFFRFNDLFISNGPYNLDPVCDLQIVTALPLAGFSYVPVEFDASGSTDPDPGDTLSFSWDFNDDGTFGDAYDSGTDDNPVKLFTEDYAGFVTVRVDDGNGGVSECSVEIDVTLYPSKNIPLRSGVIARDIACETGDGDVLILYSDGQVYKYTESNGYQSGSAFYNCGYTNLSWITCSPDGYSVVSGSIGGPGSTRSYSPTGNYIYTMNSWVGTINYWRSIVCNFERGSYVNNYIAWVGTDWGGGSYQSNCQTYNYTNGSGSGYWINPLLPGIPYIHPDYVVGAETNYAGDRTYVVEKEPEYRVEVRHPKLYVYMGVNWGGFGDTSPNFNDPRDISRDTSDTFYVLDELSTGAPAIKKFSATGSPQGTFGDSTSISSTPHRIEGSERIFHDDFYNLMFVVHGNSTDGYYLSIFTPDELTN